MSLEKPKPLLLTGKPVDVGPQKYLLRYFAFIQVELRRGRRLRLVLLHLRPEHAAVRVQPGGEEQLQGDLRSL